MNLFLLSWCVKQCAAWHFDKHVVKMILELAQLLSTAHWTLAADAADGDAAVLKRWSAAGLLYRATHVAHPCAVWTRAHVNNYRFVTQLALALCAEYTFRYGRVHATQRVVEHLAAHEPTAFPSDAAALVGPHGVTEPPQAIPEQCRVSDDAVAAYRRYYCCTSKRALAAWRKRDEPEWFATTPVIAVLEPVTKSGSRKRKVNPLLVL